MSVSGNPPYSWYKGTDLTDDFFWSRIFCEAMQALKNRADNASVLIGDWFAYKGNGTALSNLGQTPADLVLSTAKGFRHVNQLLDLRTTLEAVCIEYYPTPSGPYTLASLLTAAVSRADYKHSEAQLLALGYFDEEDVGEILKCIDLLIYNAPYTLGDGMYVFVEDAFLAYNALHSLNLGSKLYASGREPVISKMHVNQITALAFGPMNIVGANSGPVQFDVAPNKKLEVSWTPGGGWVPTDFITTSNIQVFGDGALPTEVTLTTKVGATSQDFSVTESPGLVGYGEFINTFYDVAVAGLWHSWVKLRLWHGVDDNWYIQYLIYLRAPPTQWIGTQYKVQTGGATCNLGGISIVSHIAAGHGT